MKARKLIEWNRSGVMREVFLVGPWAVKVPKLTRGWRQFLRELLANLEERELSANQWPEFSSPGAPYLFWIYSSA